MSGDSEGQGSLVCCSPWGCKESDTTEQLNNNQGRRQNNPEVKEAEALCTWAVWLTRKLPPSSVPWAKPHGGEGAVSLKRLSLDSVQMDEARSPHSPSSPWTPHPTCSSQSVAPSLSYQDLWRKVLRWYFVMSNTWCLMRLCSHWKVPVVRARLCAARPYCFLKIRECRSQRRQGEEPHWLNIKLADKDIGWNFRPSRKWTNQSIRNVLVNEVGPVMSPAM